MRPELGVCYYPEHWPEGMWAGDARRMAESGISWVRIGEFAWSRLEPRPGEMDFGWLDRAVGILSDAGLRVVLGTPTAAPPRWMLDRHPDMLAVGADGNPRGFGSRRHYCFSHAGYRQECSRIAAALGDRYGGDGRVGAWQVDNEYGCHGTTLSYSDGARDAFRCWLAERYGDVGRLNEAWGNVFWSMEYGAFDQVDLPNMTVTEPNPAHVLDFRRFSSDQVAAFNLAQVEALRERTGAPIIHNYMTAETGFDHFELGKVLDVASWDSYPIGSLSTRLEEAPGHHARFLRQGDPDLQAFHHDLYRAVGRGRAWVMEQQPGPVNWAPHNPAPLPGMVRLWTWEAFAHGCEVVSYFRWRQAPFAQEQMHAGLLRPDNEPAPALAEAAEVARELGDLGEVGQGKADVALVFDYPSAWAWEALPHGADFSYFQLVFSAYRACRRAGLSVDFVPAGERDLSGRKLVLAQGLVGAGEGLVDAIREGGAVALLGPRTFSVTGNLSIPAAGAPAIEGLGVRVELCESLPPTHSRPVEGGGEVRRWKERLSTQLAPGLRTDDGEAVLVADGKLWYLGGWPDGELWDRVVSMAAKEAGLRAMSLPGGLRVRRAGDLLFAFNYDAEAVEWNGERLPACGVAAWRGEKRVL